MLSTKTSPLIYLEKEQHIAWLTLNRPDRKNALNMSMWQAIPDLVRDAQNDPQISILILRSAVANIFCAGADISEFDIFINDITARDKNRLAIRRACQTIEDCTKPTIAMIEAPCVGGGCMLALSCDIRFGSDKSRYGITPAKLGLIYALSDTRRLMALVGPAVAKDILFSGRIIMAEKALQIGLINEIYPAHSIVQEVRDYAGLLLKNSPHSLTETKKLIKCIQSGARNDNTQSEEVFMAAFDEPDHKARVDAFLGLKKT